MADDETNEQGEEEGELDLTDGFKFTLTPEETDTLDIGNYPEGYKCTFLVDTVLVKNDNATLTFQAQEIERVGEGEPAQPSDAVGTSPMYKQAMGYDKPAESKIQYVKPTIQPHVSG